MRTHTPNREEQALLEVGRTSIRPWAARLLTALFLLTVVSVPLLEPVAGEWEWPRFAVETGAGAESVLEVASGGVEAEDALQLLTDLRAFNRNLQNTTHTFETDLEDRSFLRRELLPPVQLWITTWLGLGNEQAYVGAGGWLFYRPDVDYATGPGFLDPEVLTRRARSGRTWETAPQPHPLPALEELHRDLESRGIPLLLLPIPLKPMLEPERFAVGAEGSEPQNPSWEEFRAAVEELGIEVLDPLHWMQDLRDESGEAVFLATDTHWTPAAMERVARETARSIEQRIDLSPPDPDGFLRRSAVVEGQGDIAVMLQLPTAQTVFPRQRVTISPVLRGDGTPWGPSRDAEILLLGDSFTNIYSQAGLGWSTGAGLAEQLSYYLQRPVDKLALNAGGAHATREALGRSATERDNRLAGKRAVVWQFAVRELVVGNWTSLRTP